MVETSLLFRLNVLCVWANIDIFASLAKNSRRFSRMCLGTGPGRARPPGEKKTNFFWSKWTNTKDWTRLPIEPHRQCVLRQNKHLVDIEIFRWERKIIMNKFLKNSFFGYRLGLKRDDEWISWSDDDSASAIRPTPHEKSFSPADCLIYRSVVVVFFSRQRGPPLRTFLVTLTLKNGASFGKKTTGPFYRVISLGPLSLLIFFSLNFFLLSVMCVFFEKKTTFYYSFFFLSLSSSVRSSFTVNRSVRRDLFTCRKRRAEQTWLVLCLEIIFPPRLPESVISYLFDSISIVVWLGPVPHFAARLSIWDLLTPSLASGHHNTHVIVPAADRETISSYPILKSINPTWFIAFDNECH